MLMILHAAMIISQTLHPYKALTEHAGFEPD